MTAATFTDIASYGALIFSHDSHSRIESDSDFAFDANAAMGKFLRRDYGDTCEEDAEANNASIAAAEAGNPGGTVMGSYTTRDGTKLWIICSGFGQHKLGADYCNTTGLFPSEY